MSMSPHAPLLVVRHIDGKPVGVQRLQDTTTVDLPLVDGTAQAALSRLAGAAPEGLLAWYDVRLEPYLTDRDAWPAVVRHPLELPHLAGVQRCHAMVESLAMVDFGLPALMPAPEDRPYPTWLVSPAAGIVAARTLAAIELDAAEPDFAAALFEFGQRGEHWGLLARSEPALLRDSVPEALRAELERPLAPEAIARLIRRRHKRRWLAFWLLAHLTSRRRPPLRAALRALRASPAPQVQAPLVAQLHPSVPIDPAPGVAIDVVIPTLGRPQHVVNVIRDLAAQSLRPHKVIVVEQHPDGLADPQLALDLSGPWPFSLEHHTVSWVGACRARNLALARVESDWVLLLDDDVRLRPGLLTYLAAVAKTYHVQAVTAAVYLSDQASLNHLDYSHPITWHTFASGASLAERVIINQTAGFDLRLEGGYGEDAEFGMQLRQAGASILYAPGEPILHLKAPAGGFRYTFPHPWRYDAVGPRPSPTILCYRRRYGTWAMQHGYWLFYTISRLRATPPYRWLQELLLLTRQWRAGLMWADWLERQTYPAAELLEHDPR